MAESVRIRGAVAAERPLLKSLQARASLANPGDRDALLHHSDAIDVPIEQIEAGHVFVAESAGTIVGFAAVVPPSDGIAELDALFGELDCWRRGIGRVLIDHAIELARASGVEALHVIGNPHAESFYREWLRADRHVQDALRRWVTDAPVATARLMHARRTSRTAWRRSMCTGARSARAESDTTRAPDGRGS